MHFFKPPFIEHEINARYKELAKILHPDAGGTNELFKQLQNEKAEALKLINPKKIIKRVKMKRRQVSPATKIILNIDPEKALSFLKEINKIFK